MNALTPLKQKRRFCGTALQKLRLRATYRLAALHAKLFEKPFWFFEQWRWRLADRIDNEKHER